MTPTIREFLFALSGSLAASIIAKVTITTAFGLLAAWLARDNRAAVRHALLAAMFGVISLLPAASLLMPPLHIRVPAVIENPTTSLPFGIGADAEPPATTVGVGTRFAAVIPSESKRSVSNLLLGGWAAGVAVFLLPVVAGLWQIRSLRRSGLPWRRGQSIVESLALNAGIHRRVEALLHEAMPGPMTCGVVNPVIVLPRDAETWNSEDLNRAIVHELEHVRRGDSASRSLARAICAVYWFHPLVWIAWRKLVLEAERACDDAVLIRSEATAYADQLVGLAKRMSAAQGSPLLAMATRADLATRVAAVLNARQRRGRTGMLALVLACAAAVVLVIAMSPLTLVAAPLRDAIAQSASTLRSDAGLSDPATPGLPSESHTKPGLSRLIAQAQTAQAQTAQAQTAQAQTAQARTAQTSPAQAPQTPATATPSRLLTLFFDLNSLDAQTLMRAREAAIKFVRTQAIPSDRIAVMMYTSKLNVLTDFTNNQDSILAALGMISTADAGSTGTDNPVAGTEPNIFTVDRQLPALQDAQLAALQDAIKLLGALPEKKALIYFAKGVQARVVDNQAQVQATINAAVRANVSIWPVDARGLVTAPLR
jgi:beta-lactamase regulating signal transducer with metallopeptidase domain